MFLPGPYSVFRREPTGLARSQAGVLLGRRILALAAFGTRPVVARGAGGVILGTDGKPLRDRRGALVTDWSDPRAVILGVDGKPASKDNPPAYERNPAADRVPELGPNDIAKLAFTENLPNNDNTRRRWVQMAREALTAKEAAGEVVIERGAGLSLSENRGEDALVRDLMDALQKLELPPSGRVVIPPDLHTWCGNRLSLYRYVQPNQSRDIVRSCG